MHDVAIHRAINLAAFALLVSVLCGMAFLPPLGESTRQSTPLAVSLALALAAAAVLHWMFLGIAAQRSGRSAPGWVAFSMLLFPIGSAAAVILLGWHLDEPRAAPAR